MLSRRQAILGSAGLAGALASGTLTGRAATATVASPARASRRIPYGACVNFAPLQNESEYRIAIETYCQQLTPEGGLFWDYLRPARGQFNFEFPDKVLAFADINEMTMRGHTLVWYGAMPNWTKEIASAAEAERELTNHIEKVVSRYRGKIKTWHVVNEPIDDAKGSVAGLRPSVWLTQLGPKYIDMAFRLAHRVDPSAELVLNEYDIECVGEGFTARREALLTLIRDLLARGVPLHGIGLQGHIRGQHEIDEDALSRFVSEIQIARLIGSRHRARRHRQGFAGLDRGARRNRRGARPRFPARHLRCRTALRDRHLGHYRPLYVGADVVQAHRRIDQPSAAIGRILSTEAAVVGDRLFLPKSRIALRSATIGHRGTELTVRSPN
jgi:endo-1,4-beta-xylanase